MCFGVAAGEVGQDGEREAVFVLGNVKLLVIPEPMKAPDTLVLLIRMFLLVDSLARGDIGASVTIVGGGSLIAGKGTLITSIFFLFFNFRYRSGRRMDYASRLLSLMDSVKWSFIAINTISLSWLRPQTNSEVIKSII